MASGYLTLLVNEDEREKITTLFADYERQCGEVYCTHHYEREGYQVKLYQSKKGDKLVIQGPDPIEFRNKYLSFIDVWACEESQIGSDEVGVCDFLLPLVVVSVYLDKKDVSKIEEYGIRDSKKLSDSYILSIGPKLVKEFAFSKLTVSNEKYDELVRGGETTHTIKAKLHNRAIGNIHKQFPQCENIFLDQFVNEKKYFEYLENEEEVERNISFLTKSETYYPSVALASVIARYSLLLEKKKLEEKYHMTFPAGDGKEADNATKRFVARYGKEELHKVAKTTFKNFKNI
ncbi:MAG: ribonuclease HIII [Coprobacillus sp.]|nr:ribonuclease HIII [Coprobacillus sp.]